MSTVLVSVFSLWELKKIDQNPDKSDKSRRFAPWVVLTAFVSHKLNFILRLTRSTEAEREWLNPRLRLEQVLIRWLLDGRDEKWQFSFFSLHAAVKLSGGVCVLCVARPPRSNLSQKHNNNRNDDEIRSLQMGHESFHLFLLMILATSPLCSLFARSFLSILIAINPDKMK